MNLPVQSKPVHRVLATCRAASSDFGVAEAASMKSQGGVAPSECGVEPSFGWDDVLGIASKVAPFVLAAL